MTRPSPGAISALLAAALGLSIPTLANADANQLLGSWKFVSTTNESGPSVCPSAFVFRESTATITHPVSNVYPNGSVQNMNIRYVPSAKTVFAMTGSTGVEYNFTDNNHMYTETAWGRCLYRRG